MDSTIRSTASRLPFWVLLALGFLVTPNLLAQDRILIMGPDSSGFAEVLGSLREELASDFEVSHEIIRKDTPYRQFKDLLERANPQLIVLLDNAAIVHFRRYQKENQGDKKPPPAVASMAIFINQTIQGMDNVMAIDYVVPAVVCFVNLRDIVDQPVERVGVIYRDQAKAYFERQQQLCKGEQIQLVGYEVDHRKKNLDRQLRRGLRTLIHKEKVDALWILNDSALLTNTQRRKNGEVREVLKPVWIDQLMHFKKPVVVGVEPLLRIPNFGNFAVLPDHHGIGTQIAEMIIDIMENQWTIDGVQVKDPRSVHKLLKVKFARRYFDLKEEKLAEIDRLVD